MDRKLLRPSLSKEPAATQAVEPELQSPQELQWSKADEQQALRKWGKTKRLFKNPNKQTLSRFSHCSITGILEDAKRENPNGPLREVGFIRGSDRTDILSRVLKGARRKSGKEVGFTKNEYAPYKNDENTPVVVLEANTCHSQRTDDREIHRYEW